MSKANVVPIRPDDDRPPATPAAHILKFRPRTEVIGVRCPPEVAAWVAREAAVRFLSKSHFVLRIITAFALTQENEHRKQIPNGRTA